MMAVSSSTQMLLLTSRTKVVEYAAVKTLLALSNITRKAQAAAWTPFLLRLWTVTQYWVTDTSFQCYECIQANPGHAQWSIMEANRNNLEARPQESDEVLIGTEFIDPLLVGESAASNAVDLLQRILKACLKTSDGALQDLRTFIKLFTDEIIHVATTTCTTQTLSSCSRCLAKIQLLSKAELCRVPSGVLSRELLLGSVLRLLCTATHIPTSASHYSDVDDVALIGPLLETIEALVPGLSSSVLALHMNCEGKNCIPTFLCHKFLMTMMGSSDCFEARPSLALSCLNSLHSHGAGLLGLSLQDSPSEPDFLDDSPFLASLEKCFQKTMASVVPSYKHLQRQAIYIVFKIASSVRHMLESRKTTEVQGTEEQAKESFTLSHTLKWAVSQILKGWLDQRAQPATLVLGLSMDSGSIQDCSFLDHLAKSFVQLYFHEDDLMLKMLLLLSTQPSLLSTLMTQEQPNNSMRWKFAALAFTPERVFRAFLAVIQYNSSVLVDFLISEETGVLCLLYLMRSIRSIINSWPEFVKSATCSSIDKQQAQPNHCLPEEGANTFLLEHSSVQAVCSRGNVITDGLQPKRWRGPDQDQAILAYERSIGTANVGERKGKEATQGNSGCHACGLKLDGYSCYSLDETHSCVQKSVVRRVAHCLLELKLSIERMNQWSLFPYNPSALLKRFEAVMEHLDEFLRIPEPFSCNAIMK